METLLELVIIFGFYFLYKFVLMQKREYEALMQELNTNPNPNPKNKGKQDD